MTNTRLKKIVPLILGLAAVGILFQNCAKDLPVTATSTSESGAPASKIVAAEGNAVQTANLTTTGGTWTDIPGVTLTVTLTEDKTVHMTAMGSVSNVVGNQASAHCGFRFVIDNVPLGDPTWGDVIVQVANWTAWHIERHQALPAGTHVIKAQQTGWNGTTAGCTSNTNAYSAGRMTVVSY